MTTVERKAQSLAGTTEDLHLSWLVRHLKGIAIFAGCLLIALLALLVRQQQQKNIEVERYQLLQQVSHYAASIGAAVRTDVVMSESLFTEHQPLTFITNITADPGLHAAAGGTEL